MRRSTREDDNPYLLTYGRLIYSSDARYQIFHEAGHDWKLQIQFTRLSDEGLYEFRVSSKTALVLYTYLQVVGKCFTLHSSSLDFSDTESHKNMRDVRRLGDFLTDILEINKMSFMLSGTPYRL